MRPGAAGALAPELARGLGLPATFVLPAYEDPWKVLRDESNLPAGLDPLAENLADATVRSKLAAQLAGGIGEAVGFVLPLKPAALALIHISEPTRPY